MNYLFSLLFKLKWQFLGPFNFLLRNLLSYELSHASHLAIFKSLEQTYVLLTYRFELNAEGSKPFYQNSVTTMPNYEQPKSKLVRLRTNLSEKTFCKKHEVYF